jgi:uncharacterized protein YndB with AHSA1/START domain
MAARPAHPIVVRPSRTAALARPSASPRLGSPLLSTSNSTATAFPRYGRAAGWLDAPGGGLVGAKGEYPHCPLYLLVTKKRGREKLHFINAVPIRLVHDRWVSKYAAPWAAGLSALKRRLEDKPMEKVFEIYIKTTPERLWEAITNPELRRKYNFSAGVESDWTPGSKYQAVSPFSPAPICEGENIEVDPPRRLVQTFRALWSDDVKREGTSRVTWEITPIGDSCRLVVTHDQLRDGANKELYGGWMMILSGLKTLLETGELLTTPGSLLYANGPHADA